MESIKGNNDVKERPVNLHSMTARAVKLNSKSNITSILRGQLNFTFENL